MHFGTYTPPNLHLSIVCLYPQVSVCAQILLLFQCPCLCHFIFTSPHSSPCYCPPLVEATWHRERNTQCEILVPVLLNWGTLVSVPWFLPPKCRGYQILYFAGELCVFIHIKYSLEFTKHWLWCIWRRKIIVYLSSETNFGDHISLLGLP